MNNIDSKKMKEIIDAISEEPHDAWITVALQPDAISELFGKVSKPAGKLKFVGPAKVTVQVLRPSKKELSELCSQSDEMTLSSVIWGSTENLRPGDWHFAVNGSNVDLTITTKIPKFWANLIATVPNLEYTIHAYPMLMDTSPQSNNVEAVPEQELRDVIALIPGEPTTIQIYSHDFKEQGEILRKHGMEVDAMDDAATGYKLRAPTRANLLKLLHLPGKRFLDASWKTEHWAVQITSVGFSMIFYPSEPAFFPDLQKKIGNQCYHLTRMPLEDVRHIS